MRIKPNAERSWRFTTSYLLLITAAAFATGLAFLRETLANPALKITSITSTNVSITITNGISTNSYEVYGQNDLISGARIWITATGAVGQTNFTLERGAESRRFFKASINNDWDGDGVLNIKDQNPQNASLSNVLTITIRTPTNGANIQ